MSDQFAQTIAIADLAAMQSATAQRNLRSNGGKMFGSRSWASFMLFILLIFGAASYIPAQTAPAHTKPHYSHTLPQEAMLDYERQPVEKLDSIMQHPCAIKGIEFTGMYPVTSTIPNDENERIKLVEVLRKKGFQQINFERKTWQYGPRIVTKVMKRDNCTCEVHKLYYSTTHMTKLKVSESIKCYKSN
jgi:hypothetical protein